MVYPRPCFPLLCLVTPATAGGEGAPLLSSGGVGLACAVMEAHLANVSASSAMQHVVFRLGHVFGIGADGQLTSGPAAAIGLPSSALADLFSRFASASGTTGLP